MVLIRIEDSEVVPRELRQMAPTRFIRTFKSEKFVPGSTYILLPRKAELDGEES